ncbi:MAG: hypothetical protein IT293_12870 [Deltaproteobacteria bacterium]|nr:hypothetical protein [Deltaproteobacteria bacterium]
MSLGIVLEETMSGWIRLEGDRTGHPFAFTIRAFTPEILSISAPRHFRGVVRVADREVPTEGVLTIRVSGPRYELDFDHPVHGPLHAEGAKTYSANPAKLLASLITCPLTVYKNGKPFGSAEVVYRDSMIAFPFKAVRFVSEEKAFGRYA